MCIILQRHNSILNDRQNCKDMTSTVTCKYNMVLARNTRTRLPSNLRPTTRECVHLVTSGNFRSSDKDGDHIIRSASAISENPTLHANFVPLCFMQSELLPIEVLHCGIWIFDLFRSYDLDFQT